MWRHIAESVPGLHHRAINAPGQDSCLTRLLGAESKEVLLACVADGAGSSAHSGIGADLVCHSIADSVTAYLEAEGAVAALAVDDVLQWCQTAHAALCDKAEAHGHEIREYATTLCAALLSPEGSVFFQIGDGAIIAKRSDVLGVVFWPQSGEYINTTHFLTAPDFREHIQFHADGNGFTDVALLTDGLERLALRFDSLTPHRPFFQPLFDALRGADDVAGLADQLSQFLQSDSVHDRTDDDKTLILASRLQ